MEKPSTWLTGIRPLWSSWATRHPNDSYFTVDQIDLNTVQMDRGEIVADDPIPSAKDYKRYRWQESGILRNLAPAIPGLCSTRTATSTPRQATSRKAPRSDGEWSSSG